MDQGGPATRVSPTTAPTLPPGVALASDPAAAASLLDPQRRALLEALASPGSGASVARRLGLPRQKVNYHLREMEKLGLVEFVEERRKGNCTERIVRAAATHYIVDPGVLGSLGRAEEASAPDRFSWAYLVAVAARTIRELSVLSRRARKAKKRLQTFTLHADIPFKNAESLHAFTEDLSREVARLTLKHQASDAGESRLFRFVLGAYPAITKPDDEDDTKSTDIPENRS